MSVILDIYLKVRPDWLVFIRESLVQEQWIAKGKQAFSSFENEIKTLLKVPYIKNNVYIYCIEKNGFRYSYELSPMYQYFRQVVSLWLI